MRYTALVGTIATLFAVSSAHAEVDELTKKRQIVGGGLAVSYGMTHCGVQVTPQQKAQFDSKMKDLRHEVGFDGDLPDAQIKDLIGLKTAEDEKMFCLGMKLTFPGMLAGFIAERPVKEWGKPATKAEPAAAPSHAANTAVDGWHVAAVAGAPGTCQIAHSYKDEEDDNADNAIVIRNTPEGILLALSYARWDWTAGEKMNVSLTTPDDVVQSDAAWMADSTGKVLVTKLPPGAQSALAKTDELTVKFSDGDAVFDVPKLGEALEALKGCGAPK